MSPRCLLNLLNSGLQKIFTLVNTQKNRADDAVFRQAEAGNGNIGSNYQLSDNLVAHQWTLLKRACPCFPFEELTQKLSLFCALASDVIPAKEAEDNSNKIMNVSCSRDLVLGSHCLSLI